MDRLENLKKWNVESLSEGELAVFGFYYCAISGVIKCYHCRTSFVMRRSDDLLDHVLKARRRPNEDLITTRRIPMEPIFSPSKCCANVKPLEPICKICMDAQCDAIYMPCHHVAACMKCAIRKHICPICQQKSTVERIYIS